MQSKPPKSHKILYLVIVSFILSTGEAGLRGEAQPTVHPESMARTADSNASRTDAALVQIPTVEGIYNIPAQSALARIHFPWQDLGYKVSFMGRRPGFRALTLVEEQRIEVYLKRGEGPDMVAFDLAHEFGHVVDVLYNNEARRKQWMEMRGIDPSTPWFGGNACSDYDTPAGDFAETFAYLLLGPGSYHSQMAPPPRPEQVNKLAKFCHIDHVHSSLRSPILTVQLQ